MGQPPSFGNTLARELRELSLEKGTLLQYVDDLLISSETEQDSDQNTIRVLNFLAERRYKVSPTKAQISQQWVQYLGFVLTPGAQALAIDQKTAISALPSPTAKRQLRGFLRMAVFCCVRIPNYGLIAKPLYEALKGEVREPLQWNKDHQWAFETLRTELSRAPALELPNLDQPFTLYIHEKSGIALGVLTQKLGPDQRTGAYFSEQLDSVALGRPSCLRAGAATALLGNGSSKLTLGQHLDVLTSHQVQSVLEVRGHWLTGGRLTK